MLISINIEYNIMLLHRMANIYLGSDERSVPRLEHFIYSIIYFHIYKA